MVGAVLSLFLLVTKRLYGKEWEWSIGQIKTCRKKQHVEIDEMKELSNLICGKATVGGNYNSTRDIVVKSLIENAKSSILITGYSLSDYFADLVDCIIEKSQKGVLVKFYVNHIEDQASFDKLCRYRGTFLKIYNYPKQEDVMAALHAKVISIDKMETLITSANLSYHGQEGNIELGTHIVSKSIAQQVDDVFTKLLFKKVFIEV